MSKLKGKIDFTLFVTVNYANPNGDPLNGNQPRTNLKGYGEISDVCIKRKIRNRMQDLGYKVFVQSDDRADDGHTSLKERAVSCQELKKELGKKRGADPKICAEIACREWLDVRSFGQVFAFKGSNASLGIRGPVTIQTAISLSPVEIESMQITKSANNEPVDGRSSDTMGMKHFVTFGVYKIVGSVTTQLAEKTEFSQEDAEILKECLRTLFVNDASSARPDGSMDVARMYWWQHTDNTPVVTSHRIQDAFHYEKPADPERFDDYLVYWEPIDGCITPEIFESITPD